MIIKPTRRSLILGMGASLLAAPAIVRASSLMPVKAPAPTSFNGWIDELRISHGPFSMSAWIRRPGEIYHHWSWDHDDKGHNRVYVDGVLVDTTSAPFTVELAQGKLGIYK